MGIVNISRENVTEWLQPAPLTTVGVAAVVVDASGELAAEGFAPAAVVPDCSAQTSVPLAGDATVEPFIEVQLFPRPVGSATVAFDNSTTADTGRVTECLALVPIVALNDAVVVTSGDAGVLLVQQGIAAVPVLGEAEVEFAYYGDGNFPVFPYFLPALFTDNPQNLQDAAAYVAVSGVGELDSVAGVAEATLAFTGDVVLTRQGSTPIFPFSFPVVFDAPANIQVGSATLAFDADSECVVDVIGESAVAIDGAGISYGSAVFPWTFPVALVAA